MSFSFSAAGTKEETIASLPFAVTNENHLGEMAKHFLIEAVRTDATAPANDTHEVRYSVSASGHSNGGPGSASTANISFSAEFHPVPE
jgi:hypothetical protein